MNWLSKGCTILVSLLLFNSMGVLAQNDKDVRLHVPKDQDVKEKRIFINELFDSKLRMSATIAQNKANLSYFLSLADDTKDDPIGKYVLYSICLK